MKIKFLVLLGLILLAFLYFRFNKIKDENELVIGTASGYAPFVSVNASGQYEGFDIDFANALANEMGRKLVIKDLGSMTSLFMALDNGSIDGIIWGLSITEDRLKKVEMVHYQGEETKSYPLIFWKKIPEGIKSIDDMKDLTVAVEPSSAQDVVLSRYKFINKKSTEKIDDALLNLQYGKVDAALVEPAIAKKFKEKYPEIVMMDVHLSKEDQVHGIGVTIKKNNLNLINNIKTAIKSLKDKNIIKDLEKKWNI